MSGSLELARERGAQRRRRALEAGSEFPAFVRVDRVFNLDLDWTLDTVVTAHRAAARRGVGARFRWSKGESVLTAGVEVRNDEAALVGLGAGERQTQWHSGLARAETLELSLPADAARSEVWSFVVNPQWNVVFEGFPPVLPDDVNAPVWVFRFMPRPGEKLVAEGHAAARAARARRWPSTRRACSDAPWASARRPRRCSSPYRSTQGGRHVIKLPEDARVTARDASTASRSSCGRRRASCRCR